MEFVPRLRPPKLQELETFALVEGPSEAHRLLEFCAGGVKLIGKLQHVELLRRERHR